MKDDINKPLVSVLIITYNQKPYIAETINSVLEQSYENIEIIIADDCSTDGQKDILEKYKDKYPEIIKIISNERNLGITENCNRALEKASGVYIAWLGGDDLFLNKKIELQVNAMEANKGISLCGTNVLVKFEDGLSKDYIAKCKTMLNGRSARKFIELYNHIPTSSFMFRAEIMKDVNLDSRLRIVSDWLFNVECALRGSIYSINEVLTVYRRTGNNVTKSGYRYSYLDDRLIQMDILLFSRPELYSSIKIARSNAFLAASLREISDDRYHLSKLLAACAIREQLFNFKAIAVYLCALIKVNPYRIRNKYN